MKKILTIAIPTYNRRKYLNLSLESIYSQIDDRVEVIVSDNCSQDDTESFIRKEYPQAIYYKNEANVGMENFQRCYKRATGKFIWLLGDDDVITEGSLKVVLDFLEQNEDVSLIFMNHTSFHDIYEGVEKCNSPFLDCSIGNFVTKDKSKFIKIARHQLTFISCFIISNDNYKLIDNPDKYNKSFFLQSCIAFEVSRKTNAKLGIISRICVAQNIVAPEYKAKPIQMDAYTNIFIKDEFNVYCNLAPDFGYNKKCMRKAYADFICSTAPKYILSIKAQGYPWKDVFWSEAFPILRVFPKVWITIIPAALMPSFIAKWLRLIKRKITSR